MIQRLKNHHMSRGLEGWMQYTADMKFAKATVLRAIRRLQGHETLKFWEQWRSWLEAQRQTRLELKACRAIQGLLNGMLSRAMNRWSDLTAGKRHLAAVGRTVILRLRNASLLRGFLRWHYQFKEALRLRAAAARVLAKWTQGSMFATWNLWRWEWLHQVKRSRHIARKAGARLWNKVGCAALARWRECAGEARRQRGVVGKALLRMMQRSLAMAYETWAGRCKELARMRAIISKVVCCVCVCVYPSQPPLSVVSLSLCLSRSL
jgi:hypothetical protein